MIKKTVDPATPAFPKWIVPIFAAVVTAGGLGGLYLAGVVVWASQPSIQRVGYAPKQPVAFSHKLHAGDLGMDCRYCHNTVEESAHSSIPPTQTCMNCHTNIRKESQWLLPVRESHASGLPIDWVRVHDLPEFVYFNHSAHVNRGIGCVSCHGRIDKMQVVEQDQPLTMGWCLDCHRNPEQHLRPLDKITAMDWVPMGDQEDLGTRLAEEHNIRNLTDCSTCHR
jgi:hypothetical protein